MENNLTSENRIQKVGVTAFVYDEEKALVVRRSKKENFLPEYYELPGGKVEFGESLEEALKREMMEEIGLKIEAKRPYSSFSYTSDDGQRHTIDIQFIALLSDDVKNLTLSKEHDKYQWIVKKDLDKYKISDLMREAIEKGFEAAGD